VAHDESDLTTISESIMSLSLMGEISGQLAEFFLVPPGPPEVGPPVGAWMRWPRKFSGRAGRPDQPSFQPWEWAG
jgi:hypothetical protein